MERDWWDRGSVEGVVMVVVELGDVGGGEDDEGDVGGERGNPLSFQVQPKKARKLSSCPEP